MFYVCSKAQKQNQHFSYFFSLVSGWIEHGHKQCRSSQQQESKQEVAALQEGHRESSCKWRKWSTLFWSIIFLFYLFSILIKSSRSPQVERRASLYEPGKTVLRYEEHLGSAPLPPSSREIIYGPFHSESSHTSDGSQETGDSGHYSNEESNEEMSNPSSSQSSRPESFGPDDINTDAELKQSFEVENEEMLSHPIRHSAPDATQLCCTSEGSHPALHTSQAVDSWQQPAWICMSNSWSLATSTSVISWGTTEASCCDDGNVLLLRIYLRTLYECLLKHFISILLKKNFLPVCLCSSLSVLHQSSPMMNVKKNVKKYCDTFSLYLITFHWSRGRIWALLTYYLPPCSVIVHILLPPFHDIWCSIFSDSGDKVKTFHCHVCLRRGFFYLEVFIFLNSLLFSRLWKSFCFTLFEWCMLWK